MTMILKKGSLPSAPHTEQVHNGHFCLEEIHGSYGFSGPWSRKMHLRNYPTQQSKAPTLAHFDFKFEDAKEALPLQPYMLQTLDMPYQENALVARKAVFYGPDTKVCILKTKKSFPKDQFFRNTTGHELFYVQRGSGVLSSEFGELKFRPESYIVVPKGITYRIDLESDELFALLIESKFLIEWPEHYMNSAGQATMMATICETEIESPELKDPVDQIGEYKIFAQHKKGAVTELTLDHHPFDVVGWEGALYPFLFDINNHHGIARDIHVAPPMHQTFQAGTAPYNGFALCSFVPQPNGWHPKDVPAPYAHYNVDSDEVMFFCNTSYGARKGVIQEGSLTFHPSGTPHSPHGKAAQKSTANRGKMAQRLAVMMDTFFESLTITNWAYQYRQKDYATSWSHDDSKIEGEIE